MAPSFGSTALLSDFDCPGENPLYEDGRWAQTSPDRDPLMKGGGPNCDATDSVHGNPNFSHWTQPFVGDAVEVWGCVEGGQLGAALETWRVGLFTRTGYQLQGYRVYYGGGIGKGYNLSRYGGGGILDVTVLGAAGGGYPEMLGLRTNGTEVEAWGMYAGVWNLMISVTDNTYRGPFYPGLAIEDPTAGGLGFGCFGGGVVNRTQIYRIVRAT